MHEKGSSMAWWCAALLTVAACHEEAASIAPAIPATDAGDHAPERPFADASVDARPEPHDAGGLPFRTVVTNPILTENVPDPGIHRSVDADGRALYLLSGTVDSGDFRAWKSSDLIHWEAHTPLFGRGAPSGPSLALGEAHYCALWAPSFTSLASGRTFLTFTATRFGEPQAECPEAREDTGVYVAAAADPFGVFSNPEPLAAASTCTHEQPAAPTFAEPTCLGGDCELVARLDGKSFVDPADGRAWMGYAWYTNSPPADAWEEAHFGEHVSIVELDRADLRRVACDAAAPVHVGDPHDDATLAALGASCPRCQEHLSTSLGRDGEEVTRDGVSWGVVEGPSFLRRGAFVYVFLSSSTWDSVDYTVYYAFAPTVAELALDSPTRRVGRLLIPGGGQSFGHGTPVLGPDGVHTYFVHHRLVHAPCFTDDDCPRDVWLSPLDFEDHGDGLGAVWPRPLFPAEDDTVAVWWSF